MISLSNLAEASAQEVFDHVKHHLLKQNRQSIHYGKCYYRLETPDGVLKCAAGCLISDEEYSPEFENNAWVGLTTKKLVPREHFELVHSLQSTHDNFDPHRDTWESVLKSVANAYDLKY